MSDMLCYAHSGIVTGHVDLGWSGMLMGRVTQAASPTIYGMATVNSKCRQAVCVCVCVKVVAPMLVGKKVTLTWNSGA